MTSSRMMRRDQSSPEAGRRRFFNILTFVLPSLAILGPLAPGVGPLFGFRIVVVIVIITGLVVTNRNVLRGRVQQATVVLLLTMMISSVFFLTVTQVSEVGFRELLSVSLGLGLLVIWSHVPSTLNTMRALTGGWLTAFGITTWVAWREMSIGVRMPNYLPGRDLVDLASLSAPASTLGNPNDYATMLVLGIPLLISGLMVFQHRLLRILFGIALGVTPFLIFQTGSRLGLAIVVLVFLAVVVLQKRTGTIIAIPLLLAALPVVFISESLVTTVIDPSVHSWSEFFVDGGSGSVRVNLLMNGFAIAVSTGLIGVGPGGFPAALSAIPGLASTGGIESPHSLIIEVLSQYGVVALIAFIWVFLTVAQTALARSRRVHGWSRASSASILIIIVLTPAWSMMSSTTLSSSAFWLLLASIAWIAQAPTLLVSAQAPGSAARIGDNLT